MGKINVLGFEIANLIAAGEVVDRPASIVKELIENSIDSGANIITVEIKNGGIDFIRVSDNGCGIDTEDLPIAVMRHATSKITGAEDLSHIMTLGFRGEALAAISSVTKIRILSKTRDSDLGALLESEGGDIVNLTETGCADGTTVIVEDLFFNTPARKKFLKKPSVEASTVSALVEKLALSTSDVAVKLIVDGEVKFATSGDNSLYNAIYAVLGRDVAKKMIYVNRIEGDIAVEGYISSPMLLKSTRNMQNFFINNRYVKSKTAAAAIEQAYESYIPSDKFPSCVLNIMVDPLTVDVNVHPAKMEVKFSDEKSVFESIFYAVRTALDTRIVRPEFEIYNQKNDRSKKNISEIAALNPEPAEAEIVQKTQLPFIEIINTTVKKTVSEIIKQDQTAEKIEENLMTISDLLKLSIHKNYGARNIDESKKSKRQISKTENAFLHPAENTSTKNEPEDKNSIPKYFIVGEAYNSYIILQIEEKLMIVDKHAAHERIIFEDLKRALHSSAKSPQVLMIPITLELTTEEIAAVYEFESEINSTGFNFIIEKNILNITEIPNEIESAAAYDTMNEFAKRLSDGSKISKSMREVYFESALYQASCKAAIKAGRIYDDEHLRWICDKLLSLDDIKICPHGRPVAFEITKTSIERQFKRIN